MGNAVIEANGGVVEKFDDSQEQVNLGEEISKEKPQDNKGERKAPVKRAPRKAPAKKAEAEAPKAE